MSKDQRQNKDFYSVKTNNTPAQIKDIDTGSRIVSGFYNAYNFFDDANDVLVMGAAKKSIKERGPNSSAVAKIKHALNHDLTTLPGKIVTLEEKEVDGISGIYFETKMADTQLGNDTLKNYLAGIYDNHSIGYRTIDYQFIERENTKAWDKAVSGLMNPKAVEGHSFMWLIKEIQLWEGSTVAFGCNELTPFLGMKSNNPDVFKLNVMNRMIALEKTLKTGTQTDDTMESLEIQFMQLKQVFNDVFDLIPKKEKEIIIPPAFDLAGVMKDLSL